MDSYFIAKIEVQKLEELKTGIFYKKLGSYKHTAIISDKLSDNQLLTVILIKSENGQIKSKYGINDSNSFQFETKFSIENLKQFLEETGDKNSLHFGENPIVPGLMVLDFYLKSILTIPFEFNIKFLNPLHLQKDLIIYKINDNKAIGICESIIIFEIKQIK